MRSRPWRWFPIQSFLILLFLVAPTFAGEPAWVEVRSPHFSVVTDAGEKRGREVALRFEQMRSAFAALMTSGAKVTLPVPLQIVAFHNRKAMQPYVPLWKGKPIELAGWFQSGPDRSFILLDMSSANPWHTVFHEYAHQLLNGNVVGRMDPWFEEGFAEYFSSIEVDDKEVRVGKVPDEEYLILRQDGMMKTADLFRVRQDSSTYNGSGDHRTVFYAESGLLLHYLYDHKLIRNAGAYMDLVAARRVPVEAAIQQAFGMSAPQLDKVLRDYRDSGRFTYYPIPAPKGMVSAAYAAKALSAADAQAVLADVHLHSRDYRDKAITEFEEVLKLQPDHPAALRGLGYAYLMRQDYSRAGEYFRKAVEHDSNDPRVLYYSALLLQRQGGLRLRLGGDAQELAGAQRNLEKSVALDPEFADAYSVLAYTYMSQGKKEAAIKTMRKAAALNPRNESYAFNLAQMYIMSEQYDEAIGVLNPLLGSANPGTAERAEQTILTAQRSKAAAASPHLRADSEQPPPGEASSETAPASASQAPNAAAAPGFLKGKLVAVDCSATPVALLSVVSQGKTWKLLVKDTAHAIVIGADRFSCDWKNQPVAVNYRVTGEAAGEVISVEIQ